MCERRFVGEEEVIQKNMALAEKKDYTAEYIENLPEDERVELIDGQLFYMATPTERHQGLITFLILNIGVYLKEKKGACKVYPAPLAVYLDCDNRTYLEPDIFIVCNKHKMDQKGCHGAPDFVAEIISPSTRSKDYLLKMNKYQKAGVREYWILDPEQGVIQVYDFEHEKVYGYGFQDKVRVEIFGDLEIDFSEFDMNAGRGDT